jgi:translation elongation factor P/translation initiation factor 5A
MDLIDNYSSDNDVFLPDSDSEYSGSDIEVWNPTVPAHTVSVSDDDNDDYIDTNNENYEEVLSLE